MQSRPIHTGIFHEGDDLVSFITQALPEVPEHSIIAIASKVVALAEGRTVPLTTQRAKDERIQSESDAALKTKYVWLTRKDGMLMANAGIDESNANKKLVLLPKDSYASAAELHKKLKKAYGRKKLGILITDSCPLPLRAGVTGSALGYAGFTGLREYAGKKDLFGRSLRMTRTNLADGLAATAGILMGEGNERQPLVLITGAPVTFTSRHPNRELIMPAKEDMYYPLFKNAGF